MLQNTNPLVIWNANDPGYSHIQPRVSDWLTGQDIAVEDAYQVEVWHLVGSPPFARVLTYAHDARGNRYFDPATGEPALNPAYQKLLSELPPAELLSA